VPHVLGRLGSTRQGRLHELRLADMGQLPLRRCHRAALPRSILVHGAPRGLRLCHVGCAGFGTVVMCVHWQIRRGVLNAAARKSLSSIMFKIGMNHLQQVSLQRNFDVPWPGFVEGLLATSDVVANIEPQQIPALTRTCVLPMFQSR
jgi:hypothetical protein